MPDKVAFKVPDKTLEDGAELTDPLHKRVHYNLECVCLKSS